MVLIVGGLWSQGKLDFAPSLFRMRSEAVLSLLSPLRRSGGRVQAVSFVPWPNVPSHSTGSSAEWDSGSNEGALPRLIVFWREIFLSLEKWQFERGGLTWGPSPSSATALRRPISRAAMWAPGPTALFLKRAKLLLQNAASGLYPKVDTVFLQAPCSAARDSETQLSGPDGRIDWRPHGNGLRGL